MTPDRWLTPEDACRELGADWTISKRRPQIQQRNNLGVVIASHRIYDGTEHPLAQAGMVCMKGEESK